jgi:hypothetical protein
MTTTLAPLATPLYEPALLRALRKVTRGEIGAYSPTAPLGLRNDDLTPPHLFTALFVLRRDGLVQVGPPSGFDGWRCAELTSLGVALLAQWTARLVDAVPHRVRAVGFVTPVLHIVETEDRLPRVIDTKDGPMWIALCRAWTRAEITARQPDGDECARCVDLARAGAR